MIVSNPKTWLVAPGVGVLKAIGLVLLTLSLTTNFGYKVYSSFLNFGIYTSVSLFFGMVEGLFRVTILVSYPSGLPCIPMSLNS